MWRIWYSDGSVFSSELGSWEEAPNQDVQALVIFHEPPYRTIIAGEDEYVLPGESEVKYGRAIDEDIFQSIEITAASDDGRTPPYRPDSKHDRCGGSGVLIDPTRGEILCDCPFRPRS